MKTWVSALKGVCGLAMLTLGLLACSDEMPAGPQPGVATVAFAPRPLTIPYIGLTSAKLRLNRLEIIGNVPPPPPNQPPPDHPPPDLPPRPPGVDLDALSEDGASATLEGLPQGLYSRVRFLLGRITLEGCVQGTRFHVALMPFGVVVDIRASAPQELGFDRDIAFEISLDPNFWFPPACSGRGAGWPRGHRL